MIPWQKEKSEIRKKLFNILPDHLKYYAKTGNDILPQTKEQIENHLKRAEEKRQRKLNKKEKRRD